ncbi:MAG: hypothetical protein ACC640_05630 [bacterium]
MKTRKEEKSAIGEHSASHSALTRGSPVLHMLMYPCAMRRL